ncbi:MAG: hypothetical protein LBL13_06725 [Bacteroidales bacterium]|jgi:hypothetical protein|nr:hypothetical protein [Bacteroidales bacterium]
MEANKRMIVFVFSLLMSICVREWKYFHSLHFEENELQGTKCRAAGNKQQAAGRPATREKGRKISNRQQAGKPRGEIV